LTRAVAIDGLRLTARTLPPVANIADRTRIVIAQAPKGRTLVFPFPFPFLAALLAVALALGHGVAFAQQDTPAPQEPRSAPGVSPQPKVPPGEPADSVGNRLSKVEEQLSDLQKMVGALESLLKAKPDAVLPQESAKGSGAGAQGNVSARVDALETQINALTSQLEQVTQQMNALAGRLPGKAQSLPPPAGNGAAGRQGAASPQAPDAVLAREGADMGEDAALASQAAREADGGPSPSDDASPVPAAEDQPQGLMAALPRADATSIYNQGYGDLLRRDYAAAATAFGQLVRAYPDDPLAGKAQYWLGETYYVREQYKDAAEAFLRGYKRYQAGEKAPDSLLKLAMSLAALGQKQEACSAFSELGTKFPMADERLRDEAKSERRKAGC
jgi:tol-pal system protein YbgF